ncbi:MAG: M16 family metallopeptidase [Elusimicrobiota bacterium]
MRPRLLAALAMTPLLAKPAAADQAIHRETLPNGLLWIHRAVRHNAIAAFHLYFPGGCAQEPDDKAGLTALMSSVMFKGTANRSALRIAQEAETLGASLDAGSEEDFWELDGQSTVDKFAPLLDIVRDVLLTPTFPAEEFQKEKEAHLNAIRSKKERIFSVAFERFQTEMFGRHTYGRPTEGTEASVSRLTREDLLRWHKLRAVPRGAVLVTAGNVPLKRMRALVEKTFGDWSGEAEGRAAAPPGYPGRPRAVEEKHPFEQSYLMMGWPAPPVGGKAYAAVKVLNALLGSGMGSPLFQVVREEEGLAYEVSSFYPSRRLGSAFVVYAGTDPKNLDKAQRKIEAMIADFLKKPLPSKDLEDAKQYVRGHYMMDHQTNRSLARYLGWWEILGVGHGYDETYMRDVDALTADDVQGAARELLQKPSAVVKIISNK